MRVLIALPLTFAALQAAAQGLPPDPARDPIASESGNGLSDCRRTVLGSTR